VVLVGAGVEEFAPPQLSNVNDAASAPVVNVPS
jgi:hypothetical protein